LNGFSYCLWWSCSRSLWEGCWSMTDETTALLIRARGFIERGWCRGAYAKDACAGLVSPGSREAVRWCMLGALQAAGWNGLDFGHPAYLRLQGAVGGGRVGDFNDDQETVEPVLAAFDRTIAMGS
jgi:hypothetical protein